MLKAAADLGMSSSLASFPLVTDEFVLDLQRGKRQSTLRMTRKSKSSSKNSSFVGTSSHPLLVPQLRDWTADPLGES